MPGFVIFLVILLIGMVATTWPEIGVWIFGGVLILGLVLGGPLGRR